VAPECCMCTAMRAIVLLVACASRFVSCFKFIRVRNAHSLFKYDMYEFIYIYDSAMHCCTCNYWRYFENI
jgi:hypothetical protein